MALLRPLAERENMCVILASHPSMAGIANKTGRFGNVAWRASFRGAAHFYREGELGDVDDGRRTLVGEKVQDGKPGLKIEFAFNEDGVLERTTRPPAGGLDGVLNQIEQAEYDFLAMFDKLVLQGTTLLLNEKSPDYAPKSSRGGMGRRPPECASASSITKLRCSAYWTPIGCAAFPSAVRRIVLRGWNVLRREQLGRRKKRTKNSPRESGAGELKMAARANQTWL